jgi:hypothetical protein
MKEDEDPLNIDDVPSDDEWIAVDNEEEGSSQTPLLTIQNVKDVDDDDDDDTQSQPEMREIMRKGMCTAVKEVFKQRRGLYLNLN